MNRCWYFPSFLPEAEETLLWTASLSTLRAMVEGSKLWHSGFKRKKVGHTKTCHQSLEKRLILKGFSNEQAEFESKMFDISVAPEPSWKPQPRNLLK